MYRKNDAVLGVDSTFFKCASSGSHLGKKLRNKGKMSYIEAPKNANYIGVPTTESPRPQGPNNVYTFPGAAVGEPVPSPPFDVISPRQTKKMAKEQKKKERKEKKQKKGRLVLCCSNFTFDEEEGKEKIREVLESEKRRTSLVMCCTNFEVGSKKHVDGFGK